MKEPSEPKKKPFLKKHWSNILFFGLLILLIIPNTRSVIQSRLIIPLIGAPEILDKSESKTTADYNLTLSDMNGNLTDLKQSKGKPMLINFWATWCSPCIAELPGLVKLYKEFGDKVDFYFISNEERARLQNFLSKKGLNIPVYIPASKTPKVYNSSSIPTTFLINAKGKIIASAKGMANWDSKKVKDKMRKL